MGGSVVVQTCPKLLEKKYKVTGTVVLDVVEGSPIPCLNVMRDTRHQYLPLYQVLQLKLSLTCTAS